jgi:hypothetical protein
MKVANNDRAVVVLGPVSSGLATTLRSLDLLPLTDESADATLWLPSRRAVHSSDAPVIGAATSPNGKERLLLRILR